MLELPDYKLPRPRNILLGLWQRAKAFLRRAGTVILSMMVLIWFMSSVPLPPEGATEPAIEYSFAYGIGRAVEPLLAPVGFNWQISMALIPGMAAREVAVASLGTVYAVGNADGDRCSLAKPWPANGAWPLHWLFSPGMSSHRNAWRRLASSGARPAAVVGCGSASATC